MKYKDVILSAPSMIGLNKNVIIERSLSRLWQHISNKDSKFSVISAYLNTNDPEKNKENHEELRNKLKKSGLGYVEMRSGYSYKSNGEEKISYEKSFLIPNLSKESALKIAGDYGQESIIWKDKDKFVLLGSRDDVGVGNVLMVFNPTGKNFTFNKDIVKYAFSSLYRGKRDSDLEEKDKDKDNKDNIENTNDKNKKKELKQRDKKLAFNAMDVDNVELINPKTKNKIKLKSALSYPEDSPVYKAARQYLLKKYRVEERRVLDFPTSYIYQNTNILNEWLRIL